MDSFLTNYVISELLVTSESSLQCFLAKIRDFYERFASENPEEVNAKPSVTPAIRVEGLLFVLVSMLGGKAYRASLYLLRVAGTVAFFP